MEQQRLSAFDPNPKCDVWRLNAQDLREHSTSSEQFSRYLHSLAERPMRAAARQSLDRSMAELHPLLQRKAAEAGGIDISFSEGEGWILAEPQSCKPAKAQTQENSTARSATVSFVNEWGTDLYSAYVWHSFDDVVEDYTWNLIASGTSTPDDLVVNYRTGIGAWTIYDYWFVKIVEAGGTTWYSKKNFYCYLTAEDENQTVQLIMNAREEALFVKPYSSSSCKTGCIYHG